ncbi:MAG: AAA domain-containing protein, partial [Anaerolineae bacterium]|nr:AAA domain-containing protein [Anaerolineae bacterium]
MQPGAGLRALLPPEVPFLELPASIDADNLLGGLDLQATLQRGRLVTQPGLLARAHGGIVFVEGVNLLSEAATNLLFSVMDTGMVRVEREGLSLHAAAQFSLIGTYDPAEGQPRRHLLDRVGLISGLPG